MSKFAMLILVTPLLHGQVGLRVNREAPATHEGAVLGEKSEQGHHVTTLTETHRVFTSEDGRFSYMLLRHDAIRPSLTLLGVTKSADGKNLFTYKIANGKGAAQSINSVRFITGFNEARTNTGAEIWFSIEGVVPGHETTFTIASEFGAKKTTAIVDHFVAAEELERLETKPLPQDISPEFFEYIMRESRADVVAVETTGPLK
jgi:hypothetical protein